MATQAPPIKVPIEAVDKFTRQFRQAITQGKALGSTLSGVGTKMSMYLTAPIVAAGYASARLSTDLNTAMANVGTLIPGEGARLRRFKDDVQDLAVQTGVSSTNIADGLYQVISAFGGAVDPVKKLQIVTMASRAGISSVTDALNLVSAVTKGYGDTSDAAAQQVSDFAFNTVKLGQTTFPELAASMGKAVPLAEQLNVPLHELFGTYATLTGVTGNAAEVTTQLASLMGAAIKPSAEMTRTARKLGFSSSVAMVQELGLRDSLIALNDAVGGSTQKIGALIGRKEGIVSMLALTGAQSDTFKEKIDAMGQSAGATEEAFNEQMNGINQSGAAMDKSIERLKRMGVAVGDKLLPVVVKFLDKLDPWFDKVSKMSEGDIELALTIGVVVAAMGPLLRITGDVITVTNSLKGLMGPTGVTGVFRNLVAPIGRATETINTLDGTLTRTTGKVNGLQAAIPLLGAALGGLALGELLNAKIFDPANKSLNEALQKAEGYSIVDKKTKQQKALAFSDIQQTKQQMARSSWQSSENYMGMLASIVTGGPSPLERSLSSMAELTKMQAELARDLTASEKAVPVEKQKMELESSWTINLPGFPQGTTVTPDAGSNHTPRKVKSVPRGGIMGAGGTR